MKKNEKTNKARVVFTKQENPRGGIEVYSSNRETKPRRKPPIDTRPVRGSRVISNLSNEEKGKVEL